MPSTGSTDTKSRDVSLSNTTSSDTNQSSEKSLFEEGELVDDKFCIKEKINEGGFGVIYEVFDPSQPDIRYALKLALKDDEGTAQSVKLEVGLLRRLSSRSVYFPKFHSSGIVQDHHYLVMELLGPSLAEVKSHMPDEKFSVGTTLQTGIQLINAIQVMHSIYFIHRDIKPGNMAIGLTNPQQIYLFDLGLARRFMAKISESGKFEFKPEREKAPFRGTYHYCSPQQHDSKDACRRDDLWALMYTLIEFITGILPWEDEKHKLRIKKVKQNTPLSTLLQGCPSTFEPLLKYLNKLEFQSRPSYDLFRQAFRLSLDNCDLGENSPFDWEIFPMNTNSTYTSELSSGDYTRSESIKTSENTDLRSKEGTTVDTNSTYTSRNSSSGDFTRSESKKTSENTDMSSKTTTVDTKASNCTTFSCESNEGI